MAMIGCRCTEAHNGMVCFVELRGGAMEPSTILSHLCLRLSRGLSFFGLEWAGWVEPVMGWGGRPPPPGHGGPTVIGERQILRSRR